MQKKILIVGTHTLFFNNYFITDEAPRILAKFIDDGFKIELLKLDPEEEDIIKNIDMPFWLREHLFLLDEPTPKEKYHKESFAVANDIQIFNKYDLHIPIKTDFFKSVTFDNFNKVDLIVCFGFESKEFKQFCKTNKLLGFENGIMLDKKNKNYNAVAVSTEEDNTEDTATYAMSKFRMVVNNKIYKVKHDNTAIGITYKGRGISNSVGYLPLLYI